MNNKQENNVIIYEDKNGQINLDVSLTDDTVWLKEKVCAKFAHTTKPGAIIKGTGNFND